MSEKELNSYRFTSGSEPSDEMLAQIMTEVSNDANLRQIKATSEYFKDLANTSKAKQLKWNSRIEALNNG